MVVALTQSSTSTTWKRYATQYATPHNSMRQNRSDSSHCVRCMNFTRVHTYVVEVLGFHFTTYKSDCYLWPNVNNNDSYQRLSERRSSANGVKIHERLLIGNEYDKVRTSQNSAHRPVMNYNRLTTIMLSMFISQYDIISNQRPVPDNRWCASWTRAAI